MNAYITCTGCEQRGMESQKIINYLRKNNFDIIQTPENADYVFVITCAVDEYNRQNSLNTIFNILLRTSNSTKLLIGGCLPAIDKEGIHSFNPSFTFSPKNINSLDDFLQLNFKLKDERMPSNSVNDTPSSNTSNLTARNRYDAAKKNYKIQISEGCLGNCSYCVIKNATGTLKSRSLEDVMCQFEDGIKNKEKTIMFMAGDVGSYGVDNNQHFYDVLEKTLEYTGDFKIYMHDFGIKWLIEDSQKYISLFHKGELEHKIGGLMLPIQSGSDKILTLMNRNYKIADVQNVLSSINQFSFDIGTHIIVGFPGETESDFIKTLDFLNDARFDFISCFAYSENLLAPSAKLPNKVSKNEIKQRLNLIKQRFTDTIKVFE